MGHTLTTCHTLHSIDFRFSNKLKSIVFSWWFLAARLSRMPARAGSSASSSRISRHKCLRYGAIHSLLINHVFIHDSGCFGAMIRYRISCREAMSPILFDVNLRAMRCFALSFNLRARLGESVSPMLSQMREINSEGRDTSDIVSHSSS